jgi:glycosyltransferase involved in cell wall biosynthesis
MKVLLFSRYGQLGASSRVRSFQYLPYMRKKGVSVSVSSFFSDAYISALYSGDSIWKHVLKAYLSRVLKLFLVRKYDLIIIEKEIFPFIPAFFERCLRFFRVIYIVDYDDALFHRYDCHQSKLIRLFLGRKIDKVMQNASVVIAGNNYLAQRAKLAGSKNIQVIPTVVDTEKYTPLENFLNRKETIIGWIGTPKTSHYLQPLLPVFKKLKKQFNVRFVAIGANKTDFSGSAVEVWSWSEESEVASLRQLDIGIMPLQDSPWERGKCGYKLIQYMACGLPVIASPVGVNSEIVEHGVNGLLADTETSWEAAITSLIASPEIRLDMGQAARDTIEKHYSLKVQREHLLYAIESAVTVKKQQ